MKIATIKNWACFTGDAAGTGNGCTCGADKADNAFMMICTALVLFMTIPGIALFYGGLIRGKKRAVDADAGDGDVCTGLYSLGGLRLLAGVW